MASSEKVISPGVFTNEIDKSFLPAAIGEIGAAVVGPTVKGPALVPTVVSSYSEFQEKFGDSFRSGSSYYQYLTSHTAENYLKHAGQLTVVRVLDGAFTEATASIPVTGSTTGTTYSTASLFIKGITLNDRFTIGTTDFVVVASGSQFDDQASELYVTTGSAGTTLATFTASLNTFGQALSNAIGSSSIHSMNISASFISSSALTAVGGGQISISSSAAGTTANLTASNRTARGTSFWAHAYGGAATAAVALDTDTSYALAGGTSTGTSGTAFKINTLSHGAIMNNYNATNLTGSNNLLTSGSKHNLRWEVSSLNKKKGTFTLLIRRGNDNVKRKQTLESWSNISLDPNSTNYISKIVGNSKFTLRGTESEPFLQPTGSYINKSKYVWIDAVRDTVDYLDENGNLRVSAASGSLPKLGSGSFHGSFTAGDNGYSGFDSVGNLQGTATAAAINFYEDISTQTQGFIPATDAASGKQAYTKALNLLKNQDEYDINMILLPGILRDQHTSIVTKAIDVCEDRGDCFTIIDPVVYASAITTTTTQAEAVDTNYAAMYWPWIQVPDNQTGTNRWVPPSVVMGGIYAFNDKVAHPWFAPAGLNRGGIDTAIQAERKLTHGNRDTLYDSNVNPIATFPGQGVVVWGQKTLQKKASALDRVNVRRLLIKLKKFIASTSRFLLFEQNNAATRNRFLNIVNPYMEQVQSNSGLSAFRVVMDDTNNTPDLVDRNILYGQIFVQPARTAEFIILDFTVQPTGATFPE